MMITLKELEELKRLRDESDRYIEQNGVPHPEATVLSTRAINEAFPELYRLARFGLDVKAFMDEHGKDYVDNMCGPECSHEGCSVKDHAKFWAADVAFNLLRDASRTLDQVPKPYDRGSNG